MYRTFVLLQQLSWWLIFGWVSFMRVWKRRHKWPAANRSVSGTKMFRHLLYLTFCHSIPPFYYFSYQLYKHPVGDWLLFIYDHEVPGWQLSLSPQVSEESQRYISSKMYFAKKSIDHGVPAIPTLAHYPRGTILHEGDIFRQQSLFFKPDKGNQSMGCVSLDYDSTSSAYTLIREKHVTEYTEHGSILKILNDLLRDHDCLCQPLLKNSAVMRALCGTERLTTVRLITESTAQEIKFISAILEVPDEINKKIYKLVRIDTDTGRLDAQYVGQYLKKNEETREQWIKKIAGQIVPDWSAVLTCVQDAHKLCMDYRTIGWDAAITDTGVMLIEGNSGWGTLSHQIGHTGLTQRISCYVE